MYNKVISLHEQGYLTRDIYNILHGEVSLDAIADACINFDLEQSKSLH